MISLLISPGTTSKILRSPCFRIANLQHSAIRYNPLFVPRRHLPQKARCYSDARKPDSESKVHNDSQKSNEDSKVLSYLNELEKESESPLSQFEKDAARFRRQTGMPDPPPPHSERIIDTVPEAEVNAHHHHHGPTYRSELYKEDPTFEQPRFEEEVGKPRIWGQIGFVGLISLAVWLQAGENTNFDTKRAASVFPNAFVISSEHLRRLRLNALSDRLKKWMQQLKDSMSGLPNSLSFPVLWSYVHLANGYINASEGKRAAYQICAINGFIWVLWQIKAFTPFMKRHFLHHPLSGKSYTLLTSIFSHQSFVHLLFNSFALVSFGSAASSYLTKKQAENKEGLLESTPRYHFWALFITAGLFSGLTSHVVAARYTFPRILTQLRNSEAVTSATAGATGAFRRMASTARNNTGTVKDILPSLGASGAIYATVTMSALAFPDAQVFLMFIPIPVPITWAVGGMVTMDILGILKGWRLFDHWAHLSGALFGVLYYLYGPDFWNGIRVAHAEADRRREERNKRSESGSE